MEKQNVLRGFNCLNGVYPEISTEITTQKLEAISGLSLSALTPKTRTTYWRIVSLALLVSEFIFGIYFGIDPIFTLIPITIFAIAFDQIALKGALFESFYRVLFPEYRKKIITHEAGHFLIAYLLGLPISAIVTSAWEARKSPEIQGKRDKVFKSLLLYNNFFMYFHPKEVLELFSLILNFPKSLAVKKCRGLHSIG